MALRLFERGQIVQVDCDLKMFRPILAFEDRQRPQIERLRFVILARTIQERGQRGDVSRDIRMIRAQRSLSNLD
jgi:hypothetical protein